MEHCNSQLTTGIGIGDPPAPPARQTRTTTHEQPVRGSDTTGDCSFFPPPLPRGSSRGILRPTAIPIRPYTDTRFSQLTARAHGAASAHMCHSKQTRSAERSSSRESSPADRRPKSTHTGNRRRRRRRHMTHTHPLPSGSDGQHGSHHASRCVVCATSSTPLLLVRAGLVEGEGSGLSVNDGIRRRHPSPCRQAALGCARGCA